MYFYALHIREYVCTCITLSYIYTIQITWQIYCYKFYYLQMKWDKVYDLNLNYPSQSKKETNNFLFRVSLM